MEKDIHEALGIYYQQRTERLRTLKLRDMVVATPRAFWSPLPESAPEIVARLIEQYLASFEAEWQQRIQDTDFCLHAIRANQHADGQSDYDEELAHAHNRLTLAFINEYCKPDYSIDWSKLLPFNSSKD
jgi:hypothetical protein